MAGLTTSETLKLKIRVAEQPLIAQLSGFRCHPRFADVFSELLFCLHCSVRASIPLIQSALDSSSTLSDTCPVAAALVSYYEQHIQEEMHHDEWLLDDMESLGMRRDEVLARVPPAEVASMVGSQYYWIKHVHPVALMGYLAVIEGRPNNVESLDEIVANTAVPRDALRSFYKHAWLDVHHSAEIWQLLDTLPLTPSHVALLGLNGMLVVNHLTRIIDSLLDQP